MLRDPYIYTGIKYLGVERVQPVDLLLARVRDVGEQRAVDLRVPLHGLRLRHPARVPVLLFVCFLGGGLLVVVFVGVWGCWGCWGVVGGGVGGGGGGPVLLVLGWCVVGFCGGVEVVTARSAESIAHPSTDRPPDPARHAIKSIRPTQSTPTPHCTHARTSHHPPSWCLKPRACCPCPCPCSSKPVAPALLIPPPRLPSGGGGCSSRRRLRRSILASLQAAHRSACV